MRVIEAYQAALETGKIRPDPAQKAVAEHLQKTFEALSAKPRFLGWGPRHKVRGIYLYGAVGAGKTYLMDLLCQALPAREVLRVHYHRFMQQLDQQLRELQGHADPVQLIVSQLAKQTRVLCLDEFFVQDVAQANLLALFFKAFFKHHMTLVLTSNTAVDDLYLNGVNRAHFLPVIQWIHEQCDILRLVSLTDYRYGRSGGIPSYLTPLGMKTTETLVHAFSLQEPSATVGGDILIQQRQIPFVRRGAQSIWFEFSAICQIPRCQLDYLELAERFQTFFISDVPAFKPDETVPVLLFMYLVDVLYDRGRRLVMSAAVELEKLYLAGPLLSSFERTKSRLTEMEGLSRST